MNMILTENQKRWKLAYDLRQAAHTYRYIGEQLGVSGTQAIHLTKRYERLLANPNKYNQLYKPTGKGSTTVSLFQREFNVWSKEDIIAKLEDLPDDHYWFGHKQEHTDIVREWAGLIKKKERKERLANQQTLNKATSLLRRYGYTVTMPNTDPTS